MDTTCRGLRVSTCILNCLPPPLPSWIMHHQYHHNASHCHESWLSWTIVVIMMVMMKKNMINMMKKNMMMMIIIIIIIIIMNHHPYHIHLQSHHHHTPTHLHTPNYPTHILFQKAPVSIESSSALQMCSLNRQLRWKFFLQKYNRLFSPPPRETMLPGVLQRRWFGWDKYGWD